VARKQAFEDALNCAAEADFDFRDAEEMDGAVAEPFEIDIVDANDFAAVDVYDLAVDEVLLKEEIIFVAAQWAEG
jgi:hypothetical protein